MSKCNSCAYKQGRDCKIMNFQFEKCWAFATTEEAIKREKAIEKYGG